MTESRPFRLADVLLFLLVLAAAAGARGAYLTAYADGGRAEGLYDVQGSSASELRELVDNLKENSSFAGRAPLATAPERTAHVAPGYPWVLSLVARLTPDWERFVRWGQAGLGALTAGLYFLFARRAFGHRLVAVLAGVLCAVHPFWVVNAAEIADGALTSFVLALALFLGASSGPSGGPFGSLLYGLSLAALALVRAALLPFAFVAILWFLLRCRTLPRGWLYALLAFLGFANGLVPWTIRNFQLTGDVVPVVDTLYLHAWVGHNAKATGGTMTETDLLDALATSRGEGREPLAARLAELPQKERYSQLSADVRRDAASGPQEMLRHRLLAAQSFFLGEKWLRNGRPWQERSSATGAEFLPAALLTALLLMLSLGAVGWRGTHAWRWEAMPSSLAVVWLPLPYLLSHAEALHGPRLPLDGVLLTYAAFALVSVLPRVGRGLWRGPLTPSRE